MKHSAAKNALARSYQIQFGERDQQKQLSNPQTPELPLQPPRQTNFGGFGFSAQTDFPAVTAMDRQASDSNKLQIERYRRAFSALRQRAEEASQRQRLSLEERERLIAELQGEVQSLQSERRQLQSAHLTETQRAQRLESEAVSLREEVKALEVRKQVVGLCSFKTLYISRMQSPLCSGREIPPHGYFKSTAR